jgi:hypothetical protein
MGLIGRRAPAKFNRSKQVFQATRLRVRLAWGDTAYRELAAEPVAAYGGGGRSSPESSLDTRNPDTSADPEADPSRANRPPRADREGPVDEPPGCSRRVPEARRSILASWPSVFRAAQLGRLARLAAVGLIASLAFGCGGGGDEPPAQRAKALWLAPSVTEQVVADPGGPQNCPASDGGCTCGSGPDTKTPIAIALEGPGAGSGALLAAPSAGAASITGFQSTYQPSPTILAAFLPAPAPAGAAACCTDDWVIHHRIPFEFREVMHKWGIDVNKNEWLIGLTRCDHNQLHKNKYNKAWESQIDIWIKRGRPPTLAEIKKFLDAVESDPNFRLCLRSTRGVIGDYPAGRALQREIRARLDMTLERMRRFKDMYPNSKYIRQFDILADATGKLLDPQLGGILHVKSFDEGMCLAGTFLHPILGAYAGACDHQINELLKAYEKLLDKLADPNYQPLTNELVADCLGMAGRLDALLQCMGTDDAARGVTVASVVLMCQKTFD